MSHRKSVVFLCFIFLPFAVSICLAQGIDAFDDFGTIAKTLGHTKTGDKGLPEPNPESMYGPTNINGITGNGGLSVGISREGDVTVLRWPSPSTFDHVDHLAKDFYRPRMGDFPWNGIYAGIKIDDRVHWFRDTGWNITQGYNSDEDSILITTFLNEALGLTVKQYDFVMGEMDVLVRRYLIVSEKPITGKSTSVVFFENLDPCNNKYPGVPIRDWLLDFWNDGGVDYNPTTGVLHHYLSAADIDQSIHFAIGPDRPAFAWQCGKEGFDSGDKISAYYDQEDGVYSGNKAAFGSVDAALVVPVDLEEKTAEVSFYIAAAHTRLDAVSLLGRARSIESVEWQKRTSDWWADWVAKAILPDTDDERILRTSKRLMISLRIGTDRHSGMIVASISGQPPYYLDWPRDGAIINHALDLAGYSEIVTGHNAYYARIQRPITGSYWMNYYPDGEPGGPLPLEIDADGILAWSLWDHAAFLEEPERSDYLYMIFPALAKGADFLCLWRDPFSKLPLPSFELDSAVPVQTLTGAAAAWAGLKASLNAGHELGEDANRLATWQWRFDELTEAILANYFDPVQKVFTEIGYGAAYLVWPAEFFAADHAAMRDLAIRMYEAQLPSIEKTAEWGSYNGVALESVVHVLKYDPAWTEKLKKAVEFLMVEIPTPDTHHFGEGWITIDTDEGIDFENHVAMPHLLTGAHNFITAMKFYGPRYPSGDDDTDDDDDNDSITDDDDKDRETKDDEQTGTVCGI